MARIRRPQDEGARGVAGAVDRDVEATERKRRAQTLRPFDHRDPLHGPVVEDPGGEGVLGAGQAVAVDVEERDAPGVLGDENEGG